jgi:hypothetical protein
MPTDARGHHHIQSGGAAVCVEELHVQLFSLQEAPALCELDEAAVPESALRHGDLQALHLRQRKIRVRPTDRTTASSLSMISSHFVV